MQTDRQSLSVGFIEGRIKGTEDRETRLPLQKNSTKREGVGGGTRPLHLCTVRVLLALHRVVAHCATFPRGRAKECRDANRYSI